MESARFLLSYFCDTESYRPRGRHGHSLIDGILHKSAICDPVSPKPMILQLNVIWLVDPFHLIFPYTRWCCWNRWWSIKFHIFRLDAVQCHLWGENILFILYIYIYIYNIYIIIHIINDRLRVCWLQWRLSPSWCKQEKSLLKRKRDPADPISFISLPAAPPPSRFFRHQHRWTNTKQQQ